MIIPSKRLNSFTWPIDETLTVTTTQGHGGPENNGNGEVLHITPTPRLEPHHQIQFNVILKTAFILFAFFTNEFCLNFITQSPSSQSGGVGVQFLANGNFFCFLDE